MRDFMKILQQAQEMQGKFQKIQEDLQQLTITGSAGGGLVTAEVSGCSGRDFITAVAAGYEVMERMASDFIPTVMSRGFHSGPVFGIFGAAVAASRITHLDS